jgi:hypothetical protein
VLLWSLVGLRCLKSVGGWIEKVQVRKMLLIDEVRLEAIAASYIEA